MLVLFSSMCLLGEQEQAKEVLRYKALLDSVHNDVDDVDKDTVSDLQNVSVVSGWDDGACLH